MATSGSPGHDFFSEEGRGPLLFRLILLYSARAAALGASACQAHVLFVALWRDFRWDALAVSASFLIASICFVFRFELGLKRQRIFFGLIALRLVLTLIHVTSVVGYGPSQGHAPKTAGSVGADVWAALIFFTVLYLGDQVTEHLAHHLGKKEPRRVWPGLFAEVERLEFGDVFPIFVYFRPLLSSDSRILVHYDVAAGCRSLGLQFGDQPVVTVRGKGMLQFIAKRDDYVLKVINQDARCEFASATFKLEEVAA